MNVKTMVQQFEDNRRATATFIAALPTSKLAKNQIGEYLKALVISAYATGFAHGSLDNKQMTTAEWSGIVNETGNGTGNDFIRAIINDIQFDFHALGGVK